MNLGSIMRFVEEARAFLFQDGRFRIFRAAKLQYSQRTKVFAALHIIVLRHTENPRSRSGELLPFIAIQDNDNRIGRLVSSEKRREDRLQNSAAVSWSFGGSSQRVGV